MAINIRKVYECKGCSPKCYVLVLREMPPDEVGGNGWSHVVKRLHSTIDERIEGQCAVAPSELTPVPENEAIKYLL